MDQPGCPWSTIMVICTNRTMTDWSWTSPKYQIIRNTLKSTVGFKGAVTDPRVSRTYVQIRLFWITPFTSNVWRQCKKLCSCIMVETDLSSHPVTLKNLHQVFSHVPLSSVTMCKYCTGVEFKKKSWCNLGFCRIHCEHVIWCRLLHYW